MCRSPRGDSGEGGAGALADGGDRIVGGGARLVAGDIPREGDAQLSELYLTLTGFFSAAWQSADSSAAYVAGGIIGERSGPDGYDHHIIIRITWHAE